MEKEPEKPMATGKTQGEPGAKHRIGLIGARGHVGKELIQLIASHPELDLAFVSSRALAGKPVNAHIPDVDTNLVFEELQAGDMASREAEVYILAMPNGLAGEYVAALDASPHRDALVIDVSADHRFDDAWAYGQPERFRETIRSARRIANPGCYATGAQLAIWPVVDKLAAPPHAFGVSGYSGAGTTPSPKNDPEVLRDNLLPYSLTGHLHQREISRHLNRPIFFSPHVAPFFRGITLTVSMVLSEPIDASALEATYRDRYESEQLIRMLGQEIPLVRDIAHQHHVEIGGLSVDPGDQRHIVAIATLDNLLKGAATQAVQNINLALGLDEFAGISSAA